jgi:hypothetical protein
MAMSVVATPKKDISRAMEDDMGFTLLEISGARFSTSKTAEISIADSCGCWV